MFQVVLEPLEQRRAASWLKTTYGDVDGLASVLEHVVCALRREPGLLADAATLDALQCIACIASCGQSNTAELSRAGIPSLLTRFVSLASSVPDVDADAQEIALDYASAALTNCGGETARHLCDMQLRVVSAAATVETHEDAETPAEGADDAGFLSVRIGFADYAAGETGARLWAGAVVLSMWLLEQQALSAWMQSAHAAALLRDAGAEGTADALARTMEPLRVVEIGCGPALVSAVLLESTKSWTTPHAPLEVFATDVSPHVVTEAAKTLGVRNNNNTDEFVEGGDGGGDALRRGCTVGSGVRWRCEVLDFGCVPQALEGVCDVVLASDIVYDAHIAALVAPALVALLRPGTGQAILCCESHRDAMVDFVPTTMAKWDDALELMCYTPRLALAQHRLPDGVNPNCSLIVFRRK